MIALQDRLNFYVINLDRSVERMERFEKDFASFPIPHVRVSAVDGKLLTVPVRDYDAFMFFMNVGREVSPGEIGCYFSHLKVFKMFLESQQEFALICEDDAVPIPECYEAIEQAIAHSKTWDLLRLYKHRSTMIFPYQSLTSTHCLATSIKDMRCTAAYIVNRRAAEVLIKKLVPMTCLYDTALFQGRLGVREATISPNCVVLNECGVSSTIGYSQNKRNLKPWHFVFWSCRFFRLWIRIVRYSLQFSRIIKHRFVSKKQ